MSRAKTGAKTGSTTGAKTGGKTGAKTRLGPGVSRRRALQSVAAVPFLAPLARAFAAASPPPNRLVLLMQNNGTQQANFWPDANFDSPILSALFKSSDGAGADNGLRRKATLVKGMSVPFDQNGTNSNQHDMGFARMFTGAPLLSKGGQPWGGATSVDQILARAWDIDTLTLAVLASSYQPFPKPGFNHRRSFCYVGPGVLRYPIVDPVRAYVKLFAGGGGGTPGDLDVRRRLLLRRSVLDAVAGNLSEVAGRLGADDAHKLDYHLTGLRDVERRLSAVLDNQQAACALTPSRPRDLLAIDAGAEVSTEVFIPELVDSMLDLMAVALGCGLTRIATLQFGYGGGQWGFGWKGVNMNCHADVAHYDNSDAGSSPENNARLVAINQYYASRVARLATALDAVPEGGGTLLDSTLVVWTNEQGRGDHDQHNIPLVMLGLTGQGLAAGGRVIDRGEQPFNRLGCSILNLMGKPVAGFGDLSDCGVFAGLL